MIFQLQSFGSRKSMSTDGAFVAGLARIRELLTLLLHSPETGVFRFVNTGAGPLLFGHLLAPDDAPNSAQIARSGPILTNACYGFASCLSPSVAVGAHGYARFAGEATVMMETGLTIEPGERVYLSSATPGAGTLLAALNPLHVVRSIGLVIDDTPYVDPTSPFVRLIFETCCPVPPNPQ